MDFHRSHSRRCQEGNGNLIYFSFFMYCLYTEFAYVRRLTRSVLFDQVKHVRNIESHFLSAQECIMAGYFQNRYPNPCRFSPNGYFGSKFVTVCVTGESIIIHDINISFLQKY